MKLGCSIWSYHKALTENKITQIKWLELCAKELKIDGVELLDFGFQRSFENKQIPDEKMLIEIKKICTDLKLDIYLVSAGNNFGKLDKEELEKQIAYLKEWIDIAYYLGSPIVRFFAGKPESEEKREAAFESLVFATQKSLEYAEQKGITLAVENHNHGGFIRTSEDYFKLKSRVKSDYFKLCLDTGNFLDLYTSIEKTVAEAPVIHAKMYEIKNGKEVKLDYEKIFKMLAKDEYNGYLSIEFEGEDEEFKAVSDSVIYLKEMIQKYSK